MDFFRTDDNEQSATEIISSRPPTAEKKIKTPNTPSRKFSAPARESSSDSISEFGGSENGTSSAPTVIGEKYAVVENFVAGFLDKRQQDMVEAKRKGDDSKVTDRNVLKKNATTTTLATSPPTGDFQKIMRRKGSQTKLGTVQGRDPSPAMAAASRYAVLGKKSSATSPPSSEPNKLDGTAPITAILSNSLGEEQRQQQRIKLNNEQTSPRFNSKSPTRKAAYINNDLTWPNKTKSTNRRNDNGDWMDNDDENEMETAGRNNENGRISSARGNLDDEEERDLDRDEMDESDDEEDDDDEEMYEGGRRPSLKRKDEIGENGARNRKKGTGLNGTTQKFGVKKGKTKRGDSGELAKKRRQQRGVVMRWISK